MATADLSSHRQNGVVVVLVLKQFYVTSEDSWCCRVVLVKISSDDYNTKKKNRGTSVKIHYLFPASYQFSKFKCVTVVMSNTHISNWYSLHSNNDNGFIQVLKFVILFKWDWIREGPAPIEVYSWEILGYTVQKGS